LVRRRPIRNTLRYGERIRKKICLGARAGGKFNFGGPEQMAKHIRRGTRREGERTFDVEF